MYNVCFRCFSKRVRRLTAIGAIPHLVQKALLVSVAVWHYIAYKSSISAIRTSSSNPLSVSELSTVSSAHAALSPWEGVNALDAAVLGYNNISALRQQLKPTHRVHGIFHEGKDWQTNGRPFCDSSTTSIDFVTVIPDFAEFMYAENFYQSSDFSVNLCNTAVMSVHQHVPRCSPP